MSDYVFNDSSVVIVVIRCHEWEILNSQNFGFKMADIFHITFV